MIYLDCYLSPIGKIILASDGVNLTGLWFEGQKHFEFDLNGVKNENDIAVLVNTKKWLDIYFSGSNPDFSIPLLFEGTAFQKEVWEILCSISYGETITYGDISKQIARQRGFAQMSAQAVGNAVGKNKISIIVPCHRVIGADRSLVGYAGGLDRKTYLLRLENVKI